MTRDIRRTGWLGEKPKVYVYGEVTIGDTVVVGQRVDDPRDDAAATTTWLVRLVLAASAVNLVALALVLWRAL